MGTVHRQNQTVYQGALRYMMDRMASTKGHMHPLFAVTDCDVLGYTDEPSSKPSTGNINMLSSLNFCHANVPRLSELLSVVSCFLVVCPRVSCRQHPIIIYRFR